jgi:chromosome partitioning protein
MGLDAVAIHTRDNLVLVPSGKQLAEVDRRSDDGLARSRLLQEALEQDVPEQDFLLFDCPPAAGILTANALIAADEVLIPVTGDYLGLDGVAHLLTTLKRFDDFRQSPLRQSIVVSRLHPRRRLSREVLEKLLSHFSNKVLVTPICEAAVLAECPAVGRTIFEYRRRSRSAEDFLSLARDLTEWRIR